MLDIPENIKDLFRSDNNRAETHKKIKLTFYDDTIDSLYPYELLFPDEGLYPSEHGKPWVVIENNRIETESLVITESLSESEDLTFGSCESAMLEIVVADVIEDLTGREFTLTVEIGGYIMAMGVYTVASYVKQSDRRKRKITAYDRMRWFDQDAAGWYNQLTFPMTLKRFRDSLCDYIGIEQTRNNLLFDSMEITKTINPAEISGLDILRAICEINGCFGHIDKTGQLKYIQLQQTGLYPSETLYPDEKLYPSEFGGDGRRAEIVSHYKQPMTYEDYLVDGISSLVIRQQEGDVGANVGDGENVYTIEGNMLVYGKSASQLLNIAQSLLPYISGRVYRPANIECYAMPWVEVGDGVIIPTQNDIIETFCMKRTTKGIQAMTDTIESTGNPTRQEVFGINKQITQLEGKMAVVVTNVEEVSATVTNLKTETEAQIKVLSDQITLKVSKGDVSSQISVESGGVSITGNRFSWKSTYSSMTADGKLSATSGTFTGDVVANKFSTSDGKITLSGGKLVITGAEINGTTNTSTIGCSVLSAQNANIDRLTVNGESNLRDVVCGDIYGDDIQCSQIYSSVAGEWWSDIRLKHDISYLNDKECLNTALKMKPAKFVMNEDPKQRLTMGFVADDVKGIKSELPLYGEKNGYLTLPYIAYIPILVGAIKELWRKLENENPNI